MKQPQCMTFTIRHLSVGYFHLHFSVMTCSYLYRILHLSGLEFTVAYIVILMCLIIRGVFRGGSINSLACSWNNHTYITGNDHPEMGTGKDISNRRLEI